MFSIEVWPVSLSVPAALMPWRTKKVASVTMKLGSFVLITVIPLMKPTTRPNRSTLAIPGPSVQQGGRPRGRPPQVPLAGALRRERGHLGRVRLVDDAGAGQHRLTVADRVQVRPEQDGEHDRQVPLQVLLLVDREQHLAGLDLLDRAADVERPGLRALREDRETRNRDIRVEAEEGVELLVGLERRL